MEITTYVIGMLALESFTPKTDLCIHLPGISMCTRLISYLLSWIWIWMDAGGSYTKSRKCAYMLNVEIEIFHGNRVYLR